MLVFFVCLITGQTGNDIRKILELPFGSRPTIFQQRIDRLQLVRGQVSIGIGQVFIQIGNDIQRTVHATPMPWISTDKRIDPGLLRCVKADLLRITWL